MDEPQSKATDVAAAIDTAPKPAAAAAPAKVVMDKQTLRESNPDSSSSEHDNEDEAASTTSDHTDVAIANVAPDEAHQLGLLQDFDEDDDTNCAPGHLHALSRVSDARLRGISRHNSEGSMSMGDAAAVAGMSIAQGAGGRSITSASRGSTSRGRGGGRRSANSSRSSSPLPSTSGSKAGSKAGSNRHTIAGDASTAYSTAHSHHSAHSSLDGIFDPDVLLDRLGFIDLDPPLPHEIHFGPLAAPGTIDGKSNNSGGLTPVNERLSEETLEDCHAFNDLVMIDNLKHVSGGMSSTLSMPSVAHSSLSGMRSDMSVGSLSVGSFKGGHSRGGSVAGGSLMGDGENSVLLGTLDEEGEDEVDAEV